jgi:hypothetical protein
MQTALINLLDDLAILAGDKMGPSGSSWQDVAGIASVNAWVLFKQLEAAYQGNHEPGITFPSVAEWVEHAGL